MNKVVSKKVLILELNEFNVELLKTAVEKLRLPNFSQLLQFKRYEYISDDKVESYDGGGLEPWIQWVSIHTGFPLSQHKIRNLGDVPDSSVKQFWEVLEENNLTTGIWGVMSGRGPDNSSKNVSFFLPDPWTISETATPKELNDFLELPRYIASNYYYLSPWSILIKGWKFAKIIFKNGLAGVVFLELLKLFPAILRFKFQYFIFSLFFDFISTKLFLKYKNKCQPDCCVLFINSIAHIQHHHWVEEDKKITAPIAFGLEYIDKLFSDLLSRRGCNETIVLHNGLSQKSMANEPPWFLYRQKDPINFFMNIDLGMAEVEQLMTHEAHVNFKTEADCQRAYAALSSSKLGLKNVFYVELDRSSKKRLFYRLNITHLVEGNPVILIGQKEFRFFELFEKVALRTGTHVPTGTIFSENVEFENAIPNHEFNKYVYRYLDVDIDLK
jgi:hypothetical protein